MSGDGRQFFWQVYISKLDAEMVMLIVIHGNLWLSSTNKFIIGGYSFYNLQAMQCFLKFWHLVYYSAFPLSVALSDVSTLVVQWLSYSPLDPRFAGSIPAWVDGFFQSVKILRMISFGREVKPWVPCRRFTARKGTSCQN